jgi:hypothetical protein
MSCFGTPPRRRRPCVADRTEDLTPKHLLRRNLECLKSDGKVQDYVCLYTCGSLCPVHVQHVKIQEMAKEHLENRYPQLKVVGGFLATSNDIYVEQKYRASNRMNSFLDWQTRAELTMLALKDHPFICFDKWDGQPQPTFQEYFMAQSHLQNHLDRWCESESFPRVRVVAVHGADLVEKCGIDQWFPKKGLGCVCVERPPIHVSVEQPEKFFFTMPLPEEYVRKYGREANVSSTRVQELLQGTARVPRGELSVEDMLHPQVLQRLRQIWNLKPASTSERDALLAAVKKNGDVLLKCMNPVYKNDKEIVLEAVKSSVDALLWSSKERRNDVDVLLQAVAYNGRALRYAFDLRGNREVVMKAVKQDGAALQFASSALRGDREIVLAAVEQNPIALQYANGSMQKDKSIIMTAVKKDGIAVRCTMKEMRQDYDIARAACIQTSKALPYLSEELQERLRKELYEGNLNDFDLVESSVE